jgi:hypothetical protein
MKVIVGSILVFFLVSFSVVAQDVDLRNAAAVEKSIGESNYYFLSKNPLKDGKLSLEEIKGKFEIDLKSSLAKKSYLRLRFKTSQNQFN